LVQQLKNYEGFKLSKTKVETQLEGEELALHYNGVRFNGPAKISNKRSDKKETTKFSKNYFNDKIICFNCGLERLGINTCVKQDKIKYDLNKIAVLNSI
jgi:hypothetical protein